MGSLARNGFVVGGQVFMGYNGGSYFSFSEGFSLYVNCEDQAEVDNFWIEAVPSIGGLVVLDVSNSARPVKVSELSLGADQFTHWLAWDEAGNRIILNSGGEVSKLYLLKFDRKTGVVTLDNDFRNAGSTRPVFSLIDIALPHGFRGTGLPHGAVFSR